jgi:Domain of unknown function (DUF4037)/Nucleotidyltransferase domain
MDPINFVQEIVEQLIAVRGMKAVVLGGSRAIGAQEPDSDIDLGLCYNENSLLDIAHIRQIASALNDDPKIYMTGLGEWGRWVNGGAWLTIRGRRVDFLYKNLDFMSGIIDDCYRGKIELDYYQQPPYGYYSYIYCAEIQQSIILHDPEGALQTLQARVTGYPQPLKQTIINTFTWDAQFTLDNAKKSAKRGDVYVVSGCMTRIASDLVQTLYALNETFFLSHKRLKRDVEQFEIRPERFAERIERLLGWVGWEIKELIQALSALEVLVDEIIVLCGDQYRPRFA